MIILLILIGWYLVGLVGSFIAEYRLNNRLNKKYPSTAQPFRMSSFGYTMALLGPINFVAALFVSFLTK